MNMMHNISPVEGGFEAGHPFFSVKCEDDKEGKEYVISTHNIVNLERDPATPRVVRQAIEGIWDTLSVDNCHLTPSVLRLVFDHGNEKEEEGRERSFSQMLSRCNNDADKLAPIAMEMACQSLLPSETNDLLEHFVKSKLGIFLLRDMVNTAVCHHRRPLPLASTVLKALDRQYIESPYSCCYVKGIRLDVVDTKKTGKYIRSKPRFIYGKNDFFQTATADVPCEKQFEEANSRGGCDTFYTYGQVITSTLGHMGDFVESDEEFQRKREHIEKRWTERESYATKTGHSFCKPKWYDSYAGMREMSQAKYKLVLTNAPSLSIFSALSSMKRNILTFLYMATAFREFSCTHGDVIKDEDMKWMGQKFSRYFINDETLVKSYKSPIRLPQSKRSAYMKIEELVFHFNGGATFKVGEPKRLMEKGVRDDVISTGEKTKDRVYKNIDILNVYSSLGLSESERCSLSSDGVERESVVLIPMTLGSYEEMAGSKNTIKFTSGLKDRIGFFEMPVWVAKSTLLYDKLNKESFMTLSSGKRVHQEEATTDARRMVHTLLANGYPFEEVCNMLSLSEKEIELMRGELENGQKPMKKKCN
jgi:hypothetical protein